MSKEILIITNYFPPEKGAASNRMFSMAKTYVQKGYNVKVICPLPNYPKGSIFKDYKNKFSCKEKIDGIRITRLWIYASNSKSKFVRLFSMLTFGLILFIFLLFKSSPRKVIIQCSPLFIGFFAVLISKLKRKTIILNISDLWPLAGLQMGILKKGVYFKVLERIEKFNYKFAHLILGQSQEIIEHIKLIFPKKKTYLYRNLPKLTTKKVLYKSSSKNIKIIYAGLLGVAQGLLEISRKIELPENAELDIYGDGPEAKEIDAITSENPKINFHGLIERDKLHEIILKYDFTLIPLTNRIYGSVPSKIFEYARLGLPMIYFSEGEGATLVSKYNLGYTIKDKDYDGLNQLILRLSSDKPSQLKKEVIRKTANEVFDFDLQFDKLLDISKTL